VVAITGGRISALTSILPSLVMVVGTATGIHVVGRFREARHRGRPPIEAAREAMVRMALPCGLTALTTAVGFSSLMIARIGDVRQFGIYSAVGALLAFFLGLPLTGILLSLGKPRELRSAPPGDRVLRGLSRLLIRAPWVGVLSGVVIVLISLVGMTRLKNETFLLEDVREEAPIHRATSEVDRHLGGVIGFDLVIRSEDGVLRPEVIRFARKVETGFLRLPGVRVATGPATVLDQAAKAAGLSGPVDGMAPAILAGVRAAGGADVADAIISRDARLTRVIVRTGDVGSVRSREIREAVLALAEAARPEGVEVSVGGLAVLAERLLGRLVLEMVRSTAVAFVIIFMLMSLMFRSLLIGALSMVPNFLPLVAAVGFMGIFGITVRSSIALIFAVALGIAVDDTIHVLTRYRRERREGKCARRAVLQTIRWTGRPVVLTSTVLFFGFLVFALSDFKATYHFGLIAAVTIAIALVGDLLLLPALLLMGRRAGR
jgi:predicted RND superfamily exporter protein